MLYERSLGIERRLDEVLRLIQDGEYSTPRIAEALGVSIPTVSRDISALRERGHDIRSERGPGGWRYLVIQGRASPGRSGSAALQMLGASDGRARNTTQRKVQSP